MANHSNKAIKKHIDESDLLTQKMEKLQDTLVEALENNFKKNMGVPLPSIVEAMVRETDVAMVYSTDPAVDEYINGARKVLGAAFGGEPLEIINGMLDIVEVVASKIIGKGEIKTGIHSTAARTGKYVTSAFSTVQKASAEDWATKADFFVSYYAFVVFEPSKPQYSMLLGSPMLGAAILEPEGAPTADIRQIASSNYRYSPL
jgi:hypothetical protein